MKILDDLDKKFSDSLTSEQINEILSLEGIGGESHYFSGVQLANVNKNGVNIGWSVGSYKDVGVCQTQTDFANWKKVINYVKPDIFFEMGVARGGNMLYIHDLMKDYIDSPQVFGFDINDDRDECVKKYEFLNFQISDSLSEQTQNTISNIINKNADKRCLIHFDDNHEASHVLKELSIYSNFLKSGDCIIVGDTWDEGWYNSPYQALKNFLTNNDDFVFEEILHKKMEMPCNWIFGILIRK